MTTLLQIAGVLHVGLMCAGLIMPRVVAMRGHLAALPPLLRQLFWVYYSFIALCLVSFEAAGQDDQERQARGAFRRPHGVLWTHAERINTEFVKFLA